MYIAFIFSSGMLVGKLFIGEWKNRPISFPSIDLAVLTTTIVTVFAYNHIFGSRSLYEIILINSFFWFNNKTTFPVENCMFIVYQKYKYSFDLQGVYQIHKPPV